MTVPALNETTNLLEQAHLAFTQGQYSDAIEKCRTFIKKNPSHPDAWQILGVSYFLNRDYVPAQQALEKSLQLKPNLAETLNTLGCVYKELKQLEKSEQTFTKALKLKPGYVNAWANLGLCLREQKKLPAAVNAFEQAIRFDPSHLKSYINLAQIAVVNNNMADAITLFQHALEISPEDVETRFELANLLYRLKEYGLAKTLAVGLLKSNANEPNFKLLLGNIYLREEDNENATTMYREILEQSPDNPFALNNLAGVVESDDTDEAINLYRTAIERNPNFGDAYSNLGRVLSDKGELEESEAILRKGIEVAPNFAGCYINLGMTLSRMHRYQETKELLKTAQVINPGNPTIYYNYGNACQELGDLEEAILYYRQTLALDPSHPDAQTNIGMAYLTLGNFAEGWPYYFRRPRILALESDVLHPFSIDMDLRNKHVYLLKAQGIGDEIQFLRFVSLLKSKGAKITYRADKKIKSLVEQLPFIDTVVTLEDNVEHYDFLLSVDDIPLLLNIDKPEKLPPPISLTPDPARRQAILNQLQQLGPPPYIAVTWRGGTPPKTRGKEKVRYLSKEFPLNKFSGILRSVSGTLITVQRNPGIGEITSLQESLSRPVHNFCDLNDNLEDMLALLDIIDVYVGVSNANMHLMAALKKYAFVLIPSPSEWRWMASGASSPWFPNFKVYRQQNNGSWDAAIAQASTDIKSELANRQ